MLKKKIIFHLFEIKTLLKLFKMILFYKIIYSHILDLFDSQNVLLKIQKANSRHLMSAFFTANFALIFTFF